jgi:hypothetical protein
VAPLQRDDKALRQRLVPTLRNPECPGNGRDNESWIIESSEIDEQGSVVKMRSDIGRDGQCQTRLTHTAGTGEGQKRSDLVEEEG